MVVVEGAVSISGFREMWTAASPLIGACHLQKAMKALSLAGFVLQAAVRRPPTITEVMEQRATYRRRIDELDKS